MLEQPLVAGEVDGAVDELVAGLVGPRTWLRLR